MSGRMLLLSLVVLTGAWLMLGPASLRPVPPPGELCVQLLEVGQGDSILLGFPAGERILVDAGGSPGARWDVGLQRVVPALRRAGVHRLDAVVATHGDVDHIGGLAAVLEEVPTRRLVVPQRSGAGLRGLTRHAERLGVEVVTVSEGMGSELVSAPGRLEFLHPLADVPEDWGTNDRSVVFSASMGDVSILLTGDIEARAEQWLVARDRVPEAEVLKVPHHGSRSSSTPALLDTVDPMVALAGIGEGNRHGFPHASTSARFLKRAIAFWWTGRHGTLRACTDGFVLHVDALERGGVVRELGRWGAEVLALRRERSALVNGIVDDLPESEREPSVAKRSRAKTTRETAERRPAANAPESRSEPTPEDTPVEPLLDDRTWEKRRKNRGRLRAPWK